MKAIVYFVLIFSVLCPACRQTQNQPVASESNVFVVPEPADSISPHSTAAVSVRKHETAMQEAIVEAGLINVHQVVPSVQIDLKYSSCNNFVGIDLYGDFDCCYLQPDVCVKLSCAQDYLHQKFPYYNLIIYDAVRPRSIQEKMWDSIPVPAMEKSKYVSNPREGSLHNYGAAVDVSIIDENGIVLDMGTPYDYFGEMAYPREEIRLLKEGKLSYRQQLNRLVLRDAMEKAGFTGITTEWWHFNSCTRAEAAQKYSLVE